MIDRTAVSAGPMVGRDHRGESTDCAASESHSPRPIVRDRLERTARWFAFAMIALLALVMWRVARLQLWPSRELIEHQPLTYSIRPELARRGDLLDRRGRVLATSRVGYRLYGDPGLMEDLGAVAERLGRLLRENPAELNRKLEERYDSRYVRLIPLLSDGQVEAIRSAGIRSVGIEPVLVRHRPYGGLAASLVGLVGMDHTGLSGMENRLDDQLRGEFGSLKYLRDVKRRAMWIEPAGYERGVDGQDIRLSIDIELQRIAEEELAAQVAHVNAGGGRLLILDIQTGELLAAADLLRSRPGFDDYARDPARESSPALGRLRWITDPYEPGSTFKPFVWSVASELGLAEYDEIFQTSWGAWRTSQGRLIHDSYGYESLTWEMVLVKSSNIGMAQVAERMTERQMQDAIERFGFGRPTGIGLPGETAGILTSPEQWNHYTQTSVSMGHEIAVTPVQMVRAFAAIATDGRLPTLSVIAVDPPRKESGRPLRPIIEQRAIGPEMAAKTREVLRRVMLEGTGRAANEGAHYRMFGKSGTAQLPRRDGRGYYDDRYVINFIAGAPLADPRLVVLCVIEDPDKSIAHLGGAVCGPVARNVMNRALDYLGVPTDLHLDDEGGRDESGSGGAALLAQRTDS